jgi:endoglucanase
MFTVLRRKISTTSDSMRTLRTAATCLVFATLVGCTSTTAPGGNIPDDPSGGGPGTDPGTDPGTPPVSVSWLKVSGTRIVNSNLEPVQLKGMSLFWSQWSTDFWNESVVNTLVDDWRSTVVRAAMGVEEGGYLTNPAAEKARVMTIADAAIKRGIYVIIDWHDHNATLHTEQAKVFFQEMATRYGDKPNVIFEIFNEPLGGAQWADVKRYAEQVLTVIRPKAPKSLVIVGSPTWSQDVDIAANDPISDSNVAYTLHFYAATHKASLRAKATTAMNKGLALFVTEWGTPDASGSGTVDLAESRIWLDFLNANKISWCNWSLFDKPEAASALMPGASTNGKWPDTALTTSGKFVKAEIAKR